MKLEPEDLETLQDLLEDLQGEAVALDSLAAFSWTLGASEKARDAQARHDIASARSKALTRALTALDGTGTLDPRVRPAQDERPPGPRPTLTVIENPRKTTP